MKIFSLLVAGACAQGLTEHERFDRAFGLLDTWIDTELGAWKKHDKLSNRLTWMKNRVNMNLSDGCVLAPDPAELQEIDNELDEAEEDQERGLAGIEDTTSFNQIFRLMKTVKRMTRVHLSACRKYDHYEGKFNKLKNGMVKGYQRTHRLGQDYDTFPSE